MERIDRGFRAQRSAEQSPGKHKFNVTGKLKGGVAMVKTVLCKAGIQRDTALVTFGWLAFLASFLTNDPTSVILLQTVARVLP